jgi:hypothetical protein
MRSRACAGIAGIALTFLGFAWAGPTASTDLRITVWPKGTQGRSLSWSLRCNPLGGTLPRRARACSVLARQSRPFRPVPSGTICTGIYGGPAVALVRGAFRGRQLRTWFRRTDGCQIARWNRVRVLFPIRVPPPS